MVRKMLGGVILNRRTQNTIYSKNCITFLDLELTNVIYKLFHFNIFVIFHAKSVVSCKNRLWPTLYLSDELLRIYSANLNLLV